MEPTKPVDVPPKQSTQPQAAKLAEEGDCPTARLRGIQFGLLSSSRIAGHLSVIADKDEWNKKVGITKAQDLFDARLGVPNKNQICATCNGTRRGACDRPNSCDGHFGHIALPVPIYHPLYVRMCLKILSSVCLGCSRVLQKKKRKNILQEIFDAESGGDYDDSENSAIGKPAKKGEVRTSARRGASKKQKRTEKNSDFAKLLMQGLERGVTKQEWPDSSNPFNVEYPQEQVCKLEPVEMPESSCRVYVPETPRLGLGKRRPTNDDQSVVCKYCGGPNGDGPKFPKIKLKLVSKIAGTRGRVDTIKMVVDEKAGVLPEGFWYLVGGHPIGSQEKTRTLLPAEARGILERIPDDGTLVSCPVAFITTTIPVSPNCNRLVMEDWSSTLQPRVLQRRNGQTSKLEALVRKAKQMNDIRAIHKVDFHDAERYSEELQLLAARHFRACKVVEYKMATGQEVEEMGGTLELKWLKANVLAKRSNYSARTVINGDPFIHIEEIGIPKEIAQRLTVDEKINAFNMQRWQKFVDDYMVSDDVSMPGRFILNKKKENHRRDLELVRTMSKDLTVKLGLGDTITRCLKDGDSVFVNRPPSLHKHSLVTLKVKVHPLSTIAINPLICPPFDADFDGDAFHVFVPQSLESIAETEELMTINAQMTSSQGGQPIIGLTQDSLVAGHLLTKSHVFLSKVDIQQLSMWCSSQIPVPAIVKAPSRTGPLWTGKQLFSMTLPTVLNFGTPFWTGTPPGMTVPPREFKKAEGDVLIQGGEVLICQGGAKWLDRSPNGIVQAISNQAGPVAAVQHLDCLQAVLHQWLLLRGFSVGLLDYYVAEDAGARKKMLKGVEELLEESSVASLHQALNLDRQVRHRISSSEKEGIAGSPNVEEHQGCFGLLLGDKKSTPRVAALQGAAIEKFQALAPDIENLVSGYMGKKNSLLAMVRSGSKGSMAKLTQQVGCLGLQLYKGERLLPIRKNNKLSYFQTSLEKGKWNVFSQLKADTRLEGYWESRGIIQSSYLDGLNAREFVMDSISSRCNVLRQGIEEPNQILKNLMLFLRDMNIAYDGTVRIGSGQSIVQFRYGTGKGCPLEKDPSRPISLDASTKSSCVSEDPKDKWADSELAGEPVGVLAATSIAEPAYNVKMQSIHQAQVLGTGPVQLLKEVLMVRSKAKLKINDRRSILRFSQGFGKELRALQIQRQLQKVTLEQITLTCAIEFVRLDRKMYVKNETGKGGSPCMFLRLSPWMGHLQLCKKTLAQNQLNNGFIVDILNKKHSGKAGEDSSDIFFSYSEHCISKVHEHIKGLCIWFFPVNPPESGASTSREQEKLALLLESMRSIMLPAVLNTTIRGSDNIEKVRIFWEGSGSASRLPQESTSLGGQLSMYQRDRRDGGELAVEVVVKAPKGAGKRGAAWLTLKEACIPVMDLIDWRRSTPYAIQEIYKSYGVEAARHIILKRLTLATKVMGKPVHQKHVMLVADTMTHCGDVTGLGSAGYREFCRHMSISAPFTEAAFQQPKKTFLNAAAGGASESIDGVMTSAVWGSRVPLGSAGAFQINPQALKFPTPKWPRDPLELWEVLKEAEAVHTERTPKPKKYSSHLEKSIKTQSLFLKTKQTDAYLEAQEDMHVIGTPIFKDGKLAAILLGKDKAVTRATILESDDEEGSEDSPESSKDSTIRPDNQNALPDVNDDGEEEEECTHGMVKKTKSSSILQNSKNEGWNGTVEGVEVGMRAPAMEADKRTGRKRVLETLKGGTYIDDQPVSKMQRQLVSADLPRVEDDIAIVQFSDPRQVPCSRCDDVLAAEVNVDCTYDSNKLLNISSDEVSEKGIENSEGRISPSSAKGATNGVTASASSSTGDVSKESGDRSSGSRSRGKWSLNIVDSFRKLFKPQSSNVQDTQVQGIEERLHGCGLGNDEAATMEGTSQSTRQDLNVGSHVSPIKNGSIGSTPVEAVTKSKHEQLIAAEKRKLQNLLHIRYREGDRVQGEVEKMILEDILAHHPQRDEKIGCGVDYIKVAYHPDHPTSKCFHIVRKDGSWTDFSYHKCLDRKLLKLCNSKQK